MKVGNGSKREVICWRTLGTPRDHGLLMGTQRGSATGWEELILDSETPSGIWLWYFRLYRMLRFESHCNKSEKHLVIELPDLCSSQTTDTGIETPAHMLLTWTKRGLSELNAEEDPPAASSNHLSNICWVSWRAVTWQHRRFTEPISLSFPIVQLNYPRKSLTLISPRRCQR